MAPVVGVDVYRGSDGVPGPAEIDPPVVPRLQTKEGIKLKRRSSTASVSRRAGPRSSGPPPRVERREPGGWRPRRRRHTAARCRPTTQIALTSMPMGGRGRPPLRLHNIPSENALVCSR
jgi:hypothetical protein